jgi:hypothetical protein
VLSYVAKKKSQLGARGWIGSAEAEEHEFCGTVGGAGGGEFEDPHQAMLRKAAVEPQKRWRLVTASGRDLGLWILGGNQRKLQNSVQL